MSAERHVTRFLPGDVIATEDGPVTVTELRVTDTKIGGSYFTVVTAERGVLGHYQEGDFLPIHS